MVCESTKTDAPLPLKPDDQGDWLYEPFHKLAFARRVHPAAGPYAKDVLTQ